MTRELGKFEVPSMWAEVENAPAGSIFCWHRNLGESFCYLTVGGKEVARISDATLERWGPPAYPLVTVDYNKAIGTEGQEPKWREVVVPEGHNWKQLETEWEWTAPTDLEVTEIRVSGSEGLVMTGGSDWNRHKRPVFGSLDDLKDKTDSIKRRCGDPPMGIELSDKQAAMSAYWSDAFDDVWD